MFDLTSPQDEPPSWMVVVSTYNTIEAHIIAGRLQSEGIGAWVHQDPFGSAMGFTVGAFGEVKVLVDAANYDAALAILEDEPLDALPGEVDQVIYEDDEFDDDDD